MTDTSFRQVLDKALFGNRGHSFPEIRSVDSLDTKKKARWKRSQKETWLNTEDSISCLPPKSASSCNFSIADQRPKNSVLW